MKRSWFCELFIGNCLKRKIPGQTQGRVTTYVPGAPNYSSLLKFRAHNKIRRLDYLQVSSIFIIIVFFLMIPSVQANETVEMEWQIDGLERRAIVVSPALMHGDEFPLVFCFHGRGGSMQNMLFKCPIQKYWPKAVVVYMQGEPPPEPAQGTESGWQLNVNDENGRDLTFFDEALATMKQNYSIDEKRIYATGHSQGGGFTYLLWNTRAEVFAAIACSSGYMRKTVLNTDPLPVLHVAGDQDPVFPIEKQLKVIDIIKERNHCVKRGVQLRDGTVLYRSKFGADVATFIHSGGHKYHPKAPQLAVRFFKRYNRIP